MMPLDIEWRKGNQRFYKITTQKDMFSLHTLTCVWGGINNRLGNFKTVIFDSPQQASEFVNNMHKTRTRRGYQLVGKPEKLI